MDISYVDQEHEFLDPDKSVWETISEGEEWLAMGDTKMNSRAYVSRFNFSGSDQEKKISSLSGGERNRVHLARVMKRIRLIKPVTKVTRVKSRKVRKVIKKTIGLN